MADHRTIRWAGASEGGSRKEKNEDSWVAFTAGASSSSVLAESGEVGLETQDVIFAVSDGMGGGNAGELASALIIEKLSAIIPETFKAAAKGLFPSSLEYLTDVLRQVNDAINLAAEGEEDKKGMGATLALAWFAPENLYLANIGDSRIYRCRDGKTEQISKDHTSAWAAWKRGEMQEAQYPGSSAPGSSLWSGGRGASRGFSPRGCGAIPVGRSFYDLLRWPDRWAVGKEDRHLLGEW